MNEVLKFSDYEIRNVVLDWVYENVCKNWEIEWNVLQDNKLSWVQGDQVLKIQFRIYWNYS